MAKRRGPTVIKDRTKVKYDWNDSFNVLLEKLGESMNPTKSVDVIAFFFFFKPTY